MNGKKLRGRLVARKSSFEKMKLATRPGFKRPGSLKKNYPAGKNKSHKS